MYETLELKPVAWEELQGSLKGMIESIIYMVIKAIVVVVVTVLTGVGGQLMQYILI
jgi:hypothetical protein